MQLANIPAKITVPWANNAGSQYIRVIPNASQIGHVNGAASWADGFVPLNFTAVSAGGIPPFGADANGALNQMSAWDRWYQAGAPVNYDPSFQASISGYPKGSVVGSLGTNYLLWQSTVDGNVTNPEGTNAANWQTPVFPDPSITGVTPPPNLALTVRPANPTAANTNGAGVAFIGTGATSPNKYFRVRGGTFAIVNNAYTAEIFTLNDGGDLSNLHNVTASGNGTFGVLIVGSGTTGNASVAGDITVNGTATVKGALTANSAAITNNLTANSAAITKDLSVGGNLTVTGNETVTGTGTYTGALKGLSSLYAGTYFSPNSYGSNQWNFQVVTNVNNVANTLRQRYTSADWWFDEFQTSNNERIWWGTIATPTHTPEVFMTLDNQGSITTRLNATIGGQLNVGLNAYVYQSLHFTGGPRTQVWGDTTTDAGAIIFVAPTDSTKPMQLGVQGYGGSLEYVTNTLPSGGGAWNCDANGNTNQAGTCTAKGFPTNSDATLKTNIEPWKAGLAEIMQIETVSFEYLDELHPGKRHGVTAQQVQEVLPEAVVELPQYQTAEERKAGEAPDILLGVEYSVIVSAAVNAIKELAARVDALEQD